MCINVWILDLNICEVDILLRLRQLQLSLFCWTRVQIRGIWLFWWGCSSALVWDMRLLCICPEAGFISGLPTQAHVVRFVFQKNLVCMCDFLGWPLLWWSPLAGRGRTSLCIPVTLTMPGCGCPSSSGLMAASHLWENSSTMAWRYWHQFEYGHFRWEHLLSHHLLLVVWSCTKPQN